MVKKSSFQVERIDWRDACSDRGWCVRSEMDGEAMPVTSIGIVVNETKGTLTISTSNSMGRSLDPLTIPKKWIQRRKRILTLQ